VGGYLTVQYGEAPPQGPAPNTLLYTILTEKGNGWVNKHHRDGAQIFPLWIPAKAKGTST